MVEAGQGVCRYFTREINRVSFSRSGREILVRWVEEANMVGIAIACGIFVLAIILVIVLFDIHRLRINTKKVHDELLEIRAKLDALQSHM